MYFYESIFSRVVFPAPEGPIIAINSPDFAYPETLLSIHLTPLCLVGTVEILISFQVSTTAYDPKL